MAKFIYVDNSNLWIEGKHISAVKKGKASSIREALTKNICDNSFRIDYGKLTNLIAGTQNDVSRALLVGSVPPPQDSLWEQIKQRGYEVIKYSRNLNNHEKKVDTTILTNMLKDIYTKMTNKDIIYLVAGDSDFAPAIEIAKQQNIKVCVCFWSHASTELKKAADQFISLNGKIDKIKP
uniref:NYN domain-containing protein n=1 Tax=Barnesiella intestinihominis TaxID=487174 RepID=UPI003FEFC08F